MGSGESTCLVAAEPDRIDNRKVAAIDDPDFRVHAIYVVEILLVGVGREVNVKRRAEITRARCHYELIDERTIALEHLYAVVYAVADVE